MRLPIAHEGWPFVLPFLGLAVLGLVVIPTWGAGVLALAAVVVYFFRDPERSIPTGEGLLLAPADGKVVGIDPHTKGPGGIPGTQVSIFLSVLDVHVNRAPLAGVVEDVRYLPGKFLPAFQPNASTMNEQNILTLQSGSMRVVVRQIAGILARRIVCRAKPGDTLEAGERFGLIRFGSRVDVFIPDHFAVQVHLGQRVRGGETIIASHTPRPSEPAGAASIFTAKNVERQRRQDTNRKKHHGMHQCERSNT